MRPVAGRDLPREGRATIDRNFHDLLRERHNCDNPVGRVGCATLGTDEKSRARKGGGGDVDEPDGNVCMQDVPYLPARPAPIRWPVYRNLMFRDDFVLVVVLFRICFQTF
jgi:hypothetical protein